VFRLIAQSMFRDCKSQILDTWCDAKRELYNKHL